MKKMIKASISNNDITTYVNQTVLNVANYAYNEAPLDPDDIRNDYFVQNIIQDSDVQRARKDLIDALITAVDRAMGYR